MALDYADQMQETGSFTAAASPVAVTVTLGFKPRYVKFYTADTTIFTGEHFNGMADASFIKTISHDTAQLAAVTSAGVTLSSTGFTLGTGCQVAAKVTYWLAVR